MTPIPPLSLYVHLPWCVRKCPYCDFNSHEARGEIQEREYVNALLADLAAVAPAAGGRAIESVYFGGGTPSLFSPAAIEEILGRARSLVSFAADCEITLEANPGTTDTARFAGYRKAGINRLSIGAQSFDDKKLLALGRIHGAREAIAAAEAARAAGFDNFNLDLMYGLPGQSVDQALADAEQAIALEPAHLSCYELTIEPNTFFHSHTPVLPEEDAVWSMREAIERRLAEAGYARYEVSAYARPSRRCRHNLNYWRFGDYLGIGAGAHGKLTTDDGVWRHAKQRQPRAYIRFAGSREVNVTERRLSREELAFEFMLNALRLTEGFETALFSERTGLPWETLNATLAHAQAKSLFEQDRGCARPTALGQRFLNDLTALFLPAA